MNALETPIENIGLGTRAANRLKAEGIQTIADLTKYTLTELMLFNDIGLLTANRLLKALSDRGLALPLGPGQVPRRMYEGVPQ